MSNYRSFYSVSLFRLFLSASILALLTLNPGYRPCLAQSLTLLKEVKINTPVAVSTDRYANIYIGDANGNLYKFDSTGNLTHDYSPQTRAAISLIEAWPTLQIFVFHKDVQTYTVLNRFLVPKPGYPIQLNNQLIGFARVTTISADENVWLFDDIDFSLKKLNVHTQNIRLRTSLELILDASEYQINFMREYQHMLYVNDRNSGILVFDNLGNYKKKISFPQLDFFSFYNDELYFLQGDTIQFINLYTLAQRVIALPAKLAIKYAIVSEKNLFLLTEKSLLIYTLF